VVVVVVVVVDHETCAPRIKQRETPISTADSRLTADTVTGGRDLHVTHPYQQDNKVASSSIDDDSDLVRRD
jgi:hypothetical protein